MPTMHSNKLTLLLVLIHLTFRLASPSPPIGLHGGDGAALLAFKEALSDDSGSLSSWNGSNFCRWAGVACSRRHPDRVVSVSLPNRNLGGSISPVIGNLTFLRTLDLSHNMLGGEIPHTVSQLRRLHSLELANNYLLAGEIPVGLSNCSNLVYLNLRINKLHGGIPSVVGSLTRLQFLNLCGNDLGGHIPPSLGNLSVLDSLSLFQSNLEGTIPEALSRLRDLTFIQVGRNNLSGTIPPLFFNISSLRYLGFSSNKMHGRLPPDAGSHLPELESLLLGGGRGTGNNFSGTIPASLSNATKILELGLANNRFEGRVPPEIGKLCPEYVGISNNMLQAEDDVGWEFLRYLTNCTRLQILDLSANTLGGVLPSFAANLTGSIQFLSMAINQISGAIPPGIGNLVDLWGLEFQGNNLHGAIPEDIGRLRNLTYFSLEANLLSGAIFSLSSLTDSLLLSNNYLSGVLPPQIGNLKHATTLDLSRNNLSGEVPETLGDCASLVSLALDDNHFTGSIPPSIADLRGLSMLNFTKNALSGSIPQELSKMHGLEKLYIAHNNLSGAIPQLFENSSALVELDLSYNHLDGEVPSHGVFANIWLKLPPCEVKPHSQKKPLKLKILLAAIAIVIVICVLLFALFLCKGRKGLDRINAAQNQFFNKYPRVTYLELFEATDGFAPTNLIGAGKYGSVYRGNLSITADRNSVVAVKVFTLQQPGSSKSFLAECEALRQVKHRNLINIITCCSSMDSRGNDFRALVFDFMPRYSLDRWLRPRSDEQMHKLSLTQLLNIAIDVADALDYLHNSSCPTVIHCDLKPSNILLGSDWIAYVADFGLAKLVGESMDQPNLNAGTESTIGIRGTIGYVAPEYGAGGQASVEGDAYSFGVTLLEMFTGKAPTDDMFIEGLTLHLLVEAGLSDNISEIIDPELLHSELDDNDLGILNSLDSVLGVGVSCSKDNPSERMNMKTAAAKLHKIRETTSMSKVRYTKR
ncbi:hypothetical protein BS78_06G007100 [Paspalum vaginatum]|nr:hypothetical protein BS78_06G007100 [Paspalum vaginatum]